MIKANVDKVWEKSGEQGFVFALSLRSMSLKRAFLSISRFENKVNFFLERNKPQNIRTQESAAQQILRKYLKGAELVAIWFSQTKNNIQLVFHKNHIETQYHAMLSLDGHSGFWDFNVEEMGSLFRITPQGLFTKRKPEERAEIGFIQKKGTEERDFRDILPQELGALNTVLSSTIDHVKADKLKETQSIPLQKNRSETSLNKPDMENINACLRKIRRRVRTLKKAHLNLQQNLEKHRSHEEFLRHGEALKKYAHLWQPGLSELSICAETEHQEKAENFTIPLDKKLSLGEQVNYFYQRGIKGKRGFKEQTKRLIFCEQEMSNLQMALQELNDTPSQSLLDTLMEKYPWLSQNLENHSNNKGTNNKTAEHKPYWLYIPADIKIKILVGKSAADNDIITKNAKSHDLWFHAMHTTGSHVIVSGGLFNRLKPGEQYRVKRLASILALHHSTLRNTLAGELYMTQKTHLKKKKDMPLGKWLVEKAEILKIQYTEEEITELLKQKQLNS